MLRRLFWGALFGAALVCHALAGGPTYTPGPQAQCQTFTSSGPWTKNPDASVVEVWLSGGGGWRGRPRACLVCSVSRAFLRVGDGG